MKEINTQNIIISLANIVENTYYSCIDFFGINDKINLGIKIYYKGEKRQEKTIYFFSFNKYHIYKYNCIIDKKLDCLLINNEYQSLLRNFKNINNIKQINSNLKLKQLYLRKPYCNTKKNISLINNSWHFINIYNYYFCFCRGLNCTYEKITQKCKYFFYLYIIDNNRHIYNKTDYLFGDFLYNNFSSDDVYPIFEEMINQNLPVHYLTQDNDIIKKHCGNKKQCISILPVLSYNEIIDGDFLEKYLSLILKLKAAISGAKFFYINNLFYNINYITHISVGHGVSFFKHFLYANISYYGNKIYNKILIPSSKRLIYMAKKYGWTDENIIKINLPRWDKYNINNEYNLKNKIIFIMFTWRDPKKNGTISTDYFKNILNLINNHLLINLIKKRNIKLYFTLHHKLNEFKSKIKYSKYIKYIEEKQISEILSKTSLLISDFSSIIFDLIYRKKPYIIFIPDSNFSYIHNNYIEDYYKLIKDMKTGKLYFKNKFFTINGALNKIFYYINNNFKLEKSLVRFYDSFGFKKENATKKFIEYIKCLKNL